MGTVLKSLVTLLICLVVADVIGVVACTLFDITPLRGSSAGLPYAIWVVLGVFAGMIHLGIAGAWASPPTEGDWTSLPGAERTAALILWSSIAILAGLAGFFYWLYWSRGVAGEYYVPDSMPHSITFFLAVTGGMWIGRLAMAPKADSGE